MYFSYPVDVYVYKNHIFLSIICKFSLLFLAINCYAHGHPASFLHMMLSGSFYYTYETCKYCVLYKIKSYYINIFHITMSVVYSNTNWRPFTGGRNSILNWVFKPKNKSHKNCLDCLESALFILFFTFRSHQGRKTTVNKKITVQRTKRVCAAEVFFYFLLYLFWLLLKLRRRFSK